MLNYKKHTMKIRAITGMMLITLALVVTACGSNDEPPMRDRAVGVQGDPTSPPVPTAESAARILED
jgi:hypothetical protein